MRRLYPFQLDCVNEIMDTLDRGQDPLLISPTGSGKTTMWAKVVKNLSRSRSTKTLVVVPRKSLVVQAVEELQVWGLDVGVIYGDEPETRRAQVQIGTYHSIGLRGIDWFDPDYLVLDEAHLSAFPQAIKDIAPRADRYWESKVRAIGVTATPRRSDKKTSLGEMFLPENMVFAPSIGRLIEMGYLVRPSYAICPNAVSKMMVFDPSYVLQTYLQTDHRPTLIFAPSVPDCRLMGDTLKDAGIDAAVITGHTSIGKRNEYYRRFKAEELPVLVSCCVLREGVDLPVATNLILGIDPESHSSYVQVIGRGLRNATYKDGTKKTICNIHDLTGCVEVHGRVEELEYTTDDIELPDFQMGDVPMKMCPDPECEILSFISARKCLCGCDFDIQKRRTVLPEGNMAPLLSGIEFEHKDCYEDLLLEAFEKGEPPYFARVTFAKKFGYTPPIVWKQSFKPTPEIAAWIEGNGKSASCEWTYDQLSLALDLHF